MDAQLPPALSRWLVGAGYLAEHVFDLGMTSADDREIWEYALHFDAIVVTKDQDFADRRLMARLGPQIVWIRTGNLRRRHLLLWFANVFPDLLEALDRGEVIIEVY